MARKRDAACLLTLLMLCAGPVAAAPPPGYQLVWADLFDGTGLPDPARWVYDTEANASGWYNGELQYYAVERLANTSRLGGKLHITARRERLVEAVDYGGQRYTSGRLITRGKASWTYGFVEVRAKLPCARGAWPAIWMLADSGVWPAGGEIDIMEKINTDPTIYATVHTAASAGTSGIQGTRQLGSACSAFHDYQLTWTPDALAFGIDGHVYHRYANARTGSAEWPFDKPMYLILNLAIGGDWAGPPDDAAFPMQMQIEAVRVYQLPK